MATVMSSSAASPAPPPCQHVPERHPLLPEALEADSFCRTVMALVAAHNDGDARVHAEIGGDAIRVRVPRAPSLKLRVEGVPLEALQDAGLKRRNTVRVGSGCRLTQSEAQLFMRGALRLPADEEALREYGADLADDDVLAVLRSCAAGVERRAADVREVVLRARSFTEDVLRAAAHYGAILAVEFKLPPDAAGGDAAAYSDDWGGDATYQVVVALPHNATLHLVVSP